MVSKGTKSREAASEAPIDKSYRLERVGPGFIVVEIQTQGDRVISRKEVSEPDMRPIATNTLIRMLG